MQIEGDWKNVVKISRRVDGEMGEGKASTKRSWLSLNKLKTRGSELKISNRKVDSTERSMDFK